MAQAAENRTKCSWTKGEGASLTSSAFKCYHMMLAFANKDGEAWPCRETIRQLMMLKNKRQVTRLWSELQDWELLEELRKLPSGVTVWRVIVK